MLVEEGYLLQLLAACRKGMKQQQEQLPQQQVLEGCAIPEVQVCESLAFAICDLLHSQYDEQLQQLLEPNAKVQQQQQQERTLKITLDKLVLANLELGFKKEAGYVLSGFEHSETRPFAAAAAVAAFGASGVTLVLVVKPSFLKLHQLRCCGMFLAADFCCSRRPFGAWRWA